MTQRISLNILDTYLTTIPFPHSEYNLILKSSTQDTFLRNPPNKSSQDLCFSNAVLHFLTASCRFRVEEPLYYLLLFHNFVLLNQLHSSVLVLHTSDNPVSCKDHIFCLRDYSFLISSM